MNPASEARKRLDQDVAELRDEWEGAWKARVPLSHRGVTTSLLGSQSYVEMQVDGSFLSFFMARVTPEFREAHVVAEWPAVVPPVG